jgi:hypothetical protein
MRRFLFLVTLGIASLLLPSRPAFAQCGGERWPVKIGTDLDVSRVNLSPPTATTIANLIAIAAPKKLQDNRRIIPTETNVYVVNAILKKYMKMYDSDYHMVIADSSGRTMIAEIPSPGCVGSNSPFAAAIAHARAQFDAMFNATNSFQNADVPVIITGVGFFDYLEGQTGQAPNGIELHPVIDITFDSHFSLSSSPSSVTISQGAAGTSTITSTPSGNFNSSVALSVSGLPAGTTAFLSPSSISAPGGGSSTLNISVGSATPVGTYNLMVTGDGGGESHPTTINLTVLAGGGGSAQQLLGNPGFESGSGNPAPWNVTAGVIDNSSSEAPRTGSWKAWLNGYGSTHTDTLWQQVTIPSTTTQTTLSFWLHIDTFETSTTAANDTLQVQIRNSSGVAMATLASYSNLDAAAGYTQVSFDLSSYSGQTIQVYLVGVENASLKTSFVVDDFALTTVTSTGTGDFGISALPPVTIPLGTSSGSTITTTTSGSFNSAIALSFSGLPAGASAGFSPTSISAPGAGSSTLTISVGSATTVGTYTVNVTGTGGGRTHSTAITLNVTAGGGGGGTTQQLLGNPGFENGSSTPAPWTATASVIDNSSTTQPAHSGLWKAWLNGYGLVHTDTLLQSVAIPTTATNATLTFWLHIDTAETTTTRAYDTLQVQVRNSSGTALTTLATYSNLDAAAGYKQVSFDLTPYKGQTIQLYLIGVEDTSLKTSFVVDDFGLNVTTP